MLIKISHGSADVAQDVVLPLPRRDLRFFRFFNENKPNILLFAAPQLLRCP